MTTQTKVPPTNGKKETAPEPPKVQPVATVVKQLPVKVQSQDIAPLDERLHRLNELFELQGKYNRLLATKQKLAEFKLNQKSETITLSIEDYNNRSCDFETKNPEVIAEVFDCLRSAIDSKIKAIEPLLKW